MEKTGQEWKQEQHRVKEVVGKIEKHIDTLERYTSAATKDVVQIRKHFWDDVTVNVDNTEEAIETAASIKQQAELLSEREQSHRHAYKQLKGLQRLQQSPYFGRVDFLEDGEKSEDAIYLGIHSFYDEQTEQFLVYDWRAPISSLYYDYSVGRAKYEAPNDTISGEMTLKRQYVIRNGRIVSMFDTGVTIGDKLLQEVLGNNANTQMKSIVSTIQKEQNQIIRNEKSRLLVVQGAAGSGKTSAALQRVAYLLYRYRDTLHADQIVLFSPNSMFNSYVSTVLPELGEDNMKQTTFQEYLERHIDKKFELEDPFAQMEYVLTRMEEKSYETRLEGIRYKASSDFIEVVDQYVSYLKREGMLFKDIKFRGELLISKEQMKEQFYKFDPSIRIPNRIKLISEWLLKELKEQEKIERKKLWVEEEVQLLDKETYAKVHQKLQQKQEYSDGTFDDFEREQNMLAAIVVKEHFKPLRRRVKKLQFIHTPALYMQLFKDPQFAKQLVEEHKLPQRWNEICKETIKKIQDFYMSYEDATPYLYMKDQLEELQRNTSVQHIFIDEAQDYSAFQYAFLKRVFPHTKMTILGDFNQTIYEHASENEFSQLSTLYGEELSERIVLTRSYRSTKQIIEFTKQLITDGHEIEPFQREGKQPIITEVKEGKVHHKKIVDQIEQLQQSGHKTIAVICKTAEESEEAYVALQPSLPVRLIKKETSSFDAGILIIPSYLSKGVEFDAVIIYDASKKKYSRESERKLFYTACTRAMHELYIYSVGEMNEFLQSVSPKTYCYKKM
ncbi:RNA polymerase recycling motor HelD [Bacillus pseudomycoides]|uniref:Helicase n=1 Tax=Bacillus pseudomycoides TaxID=64104 RepID=A0A2B5HIE7_9BACI|nr:RNA polymerase recycling motor HelD [Bacillus pseudomycoides]PEA82603.1 helicase [Bacillus pseudomycoides]PEM64125.1 helicase [Bacillus pseudomycoides]PFZ08055.1 helicase [Bacillus pseudomycoides]PFZ12411.1 helicase [Bacillus pseudomycoides]PGC53579.1 helicase [Bacillus pseudomycoides]